MMTSANPVQITEALLRIEDNLVQLSSPNDGTLEALLDDAMGALERIRQRFQTGRGGALLEREMTAYALICRSEDGIRHTRQAIIEGEEAHVLLLHTLPVLHAARIAVESLAVAESASPGSPHRRTNDRQDN